MKPSTIAVSGLLAVLAMPASAIAPVPAPPPVDARTYLLVDMNSGHEIAAYDADERMEPASITKLMTAYTVFYELESGTIGLDDEVRVSERAWRTPGSRMFIDVNSRVSVEDLLMGMIVQSGNDASVALAEHVAGSEAAFADLMNQHARRLGMHDSHFTNATGLPHEDLYTTARDISTLARALIGEFPAYYEWYSVREFTWNNIRQNNRNMLLWRDSSVDGMKTGHTESAGYCLVTSAERNGMRLVSIVFGADSERSRADISQSLLNYGFRFFETHRLYAGRAELAQARVWKGTLDSVPAGLHEDLHVTIPRGQYRNLDASMDLRTHLMAPVDAGMVLGEVQVRLGETVVAERPLHALAPVDEGPFWRRAMDAIRLWFE